MNINIWSLCLLLITTIVSHHLVDEIIIIAQFAELLPATSQKPMKGIFFCLKKHS